MQSRRLLAALSVLAWPLALHAQDAAGWPDNWHPPAGQTCHPIDVPGGLPTLTKVLDTSAVLSVVGWTPPASGYAIWSLGYDSTGALKRLAAVTSDQPDSIVTKLTNAIANAVEPQPPGAARVMQLRLTTSGGARFSIAPSERCDAAVADQKPLAPNAKAAVIRVPVSARGQIAGVPELATSSGDAKRDAQAQVAAMRAHYLPALVDRAPVDGVALFTLAR